MSVLKTRPAHPLFPFGENRCPQALGGIFALLLCFSENILKKVSVNLVSAHLKLFNSKTAKAKIPFPLAYRSVLFPDIISAPLPP